MNKQLAAFLTAPERPANTMNYTELHGFLDTELKRQLAQDAESRAAVLARLDQLDRELRMTVEQSGNSLAASLGELEDRLDNGNKDAGRTFLA